MLRTERILNYLRPKENERILDLGCGRGAITVACKDAGTKIVGVDISLHRAKICRTVVGEGIIIRANAITLPFKNEIFHKVTFLDVMEHLHESDVRVCLTEIGRVLKKGGMAFITTPNASARIPYLFFCVCDAVFHGRKRLPFLREIYYLGRDHKSTKNPRSLQKILSRYGFETIKIFFDTPDRVPDYLCTFDRKFMYKLKGIGGTSLWCIARKRRANTKIFAGFRVEEDPALGASQQSPNHRNFITST